MTPETRNYVLMRDCYTCQRCGKNVYISQLQIAHRIKSGKGTLNHIKKNFSVDKMTDKDIKENIIDHPLNLVTTCSLRCNDSFNVFNNPVERDKLLNKIMDTL